METKEFVEVAFGVKPTVAQQKVFDKFDSAAAGATALVIGRPPMTDVDKLRRLIIMGY